MVQIIRFTLSGLLLLEFGVILLIWPDLYEHCMIWLLKRDPDNGLARSFFWKRDFFGFSRQFERISTRVGALILIITGLFFLIIPLFPPVHD